MDKRFARQTRKFHQAKWDEEIIFELHNPGERGVMVPAVEKGISDRVGDGLSSLPASLRRDTAPSLPEVGQMRVLKHFLRLSQQTLGADLNIDIGQGTCTIKYNPKINKHLAGLPQVTEIHPWQDESTVQGALEITNNLDTYLRAISGLDYFSFQPPSGSAAIFTMASIVEKYHRVRGEQDQRDEIITTIFSHPSDYSAVAVKGYKVINLQQNEDGLPDLDALKAAVSERTAALFITNPEDTGIFNPLIREFTRVVHEAGALCCYDQANANGVLGITRAREADFDMCFFNLHKTFSTPHGCGGPGTGAIGVTAELRDYMPVPLVVKSDDGYQLDYDLPHTIGKVRSFYGIFPVILKAYCWVRAMGARGLLEAARVAVLNNNYLLNRIRQIRGASAPYAEGCHRIEQVRYSWEQLTDETGVGTEDVTARMADFGFHLWSSHHPFVVPEPFTIEPTESYSKLELDEYLSGLEQISNEAYNKPELVTAAPHNSVIHRVDHSTLDDPEKWAITWRSFLKKRPGEQLDRKGK